MTRQCIFCTNIANSKEHLFPDWILQTLRYDSPMVRRTSDSVSRVFRGDVVVKCVCKHCNEGWMSNLENEVKPFVSPLLHGISFAITKEQQRVMSVWLVKIAMVLEATNRVDAGLYTQDERALLKSSSVIPERSLIWIGRFSGSNLLADGVHIWLTIGAKLRAAHGCATTIIVGHLAAQVLTVHVGPEHRKTISVSCADGPWDASLFNIWPLRAGFMWPPQLAFSERGAMSFVRLRDRWRQGQQVRTSTGPRADKA
jgi:hypothetical protein